MRYYACKFCIAREGLKTSEVPGKLPTDFDAAAEHVERVHRYPVRRKGESQEGANLRVFNTYGLPLWRVDFALAQAIGGPNDAAARLIEASGPIAIVYATLDPS